MLKSTHRKIINVITKEEREENFCNSFHFTESWNLDDCLFFRDQ